MNGRDGAGGATELRPLRPEALLAALITHQIDFVIIGGYAVAAHGFARATKDIDICPDPAQENLRRLAAALAELDATPTGLGEFAGEFDLEPNLDGLKMGGNWTLMTRHGRLDVMQTFGFDQGADDEGRYDDIASHAVERIFLGHRVRFCSYDDLLANERAAGRAQAEVDIKSLKAARAEL